MSSAGSCCTSARISSVVAISLSAAARPRVCASGIVTVLTEQLQRFLHRTIGEGKQDGLIAGIVCHRLPARHHEDVARLPLDDEVCAYPAASVPFDRYEDGRVSRSVSYGLESLRQQLDERGDRRHRIPAGDGLAVAHLEHVTGI